MVYLIDCKCNAFQRKSALVVSMGVRQRDFSICEIMRG
jgi:hypothetical protein